MPAARGRKIGAGILLFRRAVGGQPEVLLVHSGSPFKQGRDFRAWEIPKGEPRIGETLEDCARREFSEETGFGLDADLVPLGTALQARKVVRIWGCRGDADAESIRSRVVRTEFPRRSGCWIEHPEIDDCRWFGLREARKWIEPAQLPFLDRLETLLAPA